MVFAKKKDSFQLNDVFTNKNRCLAWTMTTKGHSTKRELVKEALEEKKEAKNKKSSGRSDAH